MEYLNKAIELAKKGTDVKENPYVGAVIVKDGVIIGEGYHDKYGENHAEINAFESVITDPSGATIYVSLEPCNHHGKTPPCTEAIIKHKISKVVIASKDYSAKVNGAGIQKLRANGVNVEEHLLEEAIIMNYDFYIKEAKRPFTHIKVASSLDGKIATKTFNSKGISSKEASNYVHQLRRDYDAIMVGVNTVIHDNPLLTCRLEGNHTIKRIVIDYDFDIPENLRLYDEIEANPVILFTKEAVDNEKLIRFRKRNIKVFNVLKNKNSLSIALDYLGIIGIKSILIEGGGSLNESLMQQNLIDKLSVIMSPIVIGGKDSITSFNGEGVSVIDHAYKLKNIETRKLGNNILIEGDIDVHRNN